MFNLKFNITLCVILAMISMFITMIPLVQLSSAIGDQNAIDCNSKKGTTANTLVGSLNYGGVKCEGQNGGTAFAGGIRANDTANPSTLNQNAIDCNSKKGTTANTLVGSLNYGGVKCEGQNGGTAFAGGIGSDSSSLGIHGIHGPNDNAHFAGNIRK
jgi:hypothetical protein